MLQLQSVEATKESLSLFLFASGAAIFNAESTNHAHTPAGLDKKNRILPVNY